MHTRMFLFWSVGMLCLIPRAFASEPESPIYLNIVDRIRVEIQTIIANTYEADLRIAEANAAIAAIRVKAEELEAITQKNCRRTLAPWLAEVPLPPNPEPSVARKFRTGGWTSTTLEELSSPTLITAREALRTDLRVRNKMAVDTEALRELAGQKFDAMFQAKRRMINSDRAALLPKESSWLTVGVTTQQEVLRRCGQPHSFLVTTVNGERREVWGYERGTYSDYLVFQDGVLILHDAWRIRVVGSF